uniref:Uncharacterized protein n=1 Tax=Gadus morhua TaxID=8049 RepID=A0A8C5AGD9_GADMO
MGAPEGVLGPHGILDAVHLLLVAAAVDHGALLGVPQCCLQGLNSLSSRPKTRVTTSAVVRSVSGTSPFLQRLSSASSLWRVSFMVLFFSFSFSYFRFHCSAVSSRLMEAVFLMVLALWRGRWRRDNDKVIDILHLACVFCKSNTLCD